MRNISHTGKESIMFPAYSKQLATFVPEEKKYREKVRDGRMEGWKEVGRERGKGRE